MHKNVQKTSKNIKNNNFSRKEETVLTVLPVFSPLPRFLRAVPGRAAGNTRAPDRAALEAAGLAKKAKKHRVVDVRGALKKETFADLPADFLPKGRAVDELMAEAEKQKDLIGAIIVCVSCLAQVLRPSLFPSAHLFYDSVRTA